MNSLIKIHKTNNPIRPLINFKKAPTYKIAKILAQKLRNSKITTNEYNIKNSTELVQKLQKIKTNENTAFTSFDITNMYTNIPIQETIEIITDKLKKQNESNEYITQIKNSLNKILNQNYFKFNNKIYKQNSGLAMGSPLSSIIAEIFLQEIDKKIINIIKKYDNEGKWIRYVDNGLYISNNNNKHTKEIYNELNKIHPNIKFTK